MLNWISSFIRRNTVKNGAWLYMLQFFNLVVPLITIPYITRLLGASLYGTFSIALNIVSYLQVVVEYGFGLSATRDVAVKGKDNLSKKFTTVVLSRLILTGICFAIGSFYVLINRSSYQLCVSFIILLICLLGNCVQMNWVFQGLQEMKFISIVNVVSRTLTTLLIFLVVNSEKDLFLYCFLYSLSPFLSGWIGCILAKKRYALRFIKVGIQDVIQELKEGFFVFTTHLSSKVFGAIGVTFLGIFALPFEVGVFSAIQKVASVVVLLWSPINQVLYPLSSKHFAQSNDAGLAFVKKIKKYAIPIFTVFVMVLSINSKFIVDLLYEQEYSEYHYWLIPLLLWVLVAIDNNFLGIQTLLGSGHDKEYGEAFQIGVAATVVLNFVLTYTLKGMGAAIAPVMSELVLNLVLRWKIKKTMASNV